nr:MAG TPA: hypothetical protein [Caudoviricetes sp.]
MAQCAFYVNSSAGVRTPWRYGNLRNGGNAGLACANGNNSPSNSNWNGAPRLVDKAEIPLSRHIVRPMGKLFLTGIPQKIVNAMRWACAQTHVGASSNIRATCFKAARQPKPPETNK